jgi:uncharacterized membrane protein YqjE
MFGTVDRLQELLGRLVAEVQGLIRAEIALAQAEMAEKAKSAARALAYIAVAGVLLFFSVFGFLIAAIWGLGEVLPIWASALIVSFLFVALAALVGYIAMRRAKSAGPLYPDAAVENVRTLPDDLREAIG